MVGFFLIDKPQGWTSHDVVAKMRRRLGTKRVGHAGTLDPMATGLLIVAVGQATRLLPYLDLEPKKYEFEITFGAETDSQDAEGQIVTSHDISDLTIDMIRRAANDFVGTSLQVPPMHSAVKIEGVPLYKHARKGITVDRKPRAIHVSSFHVESFTPPKARGIVLCSGGTYVRTLAHDLGMKLGCGAHLSSLRRTKAGRFSVDRAVSVEEVSAPTLGVAEALSPIPIFRASGDESAALQKGQQIEGSARIGDSLVLAESDGRPVALCRVVGTQLQPTVVLNPAFD